MKNLLYLILINFAFVGFAQEKSSDLPYYEIPEASEEYTAGTVASRLLDGLGFRYYWATEGLTEKDLNFRPNEDARASEETIKHIYGLSKVIVNATLRKPNLPSNEDELTFKEIRERTLNNFKTASEILRASNDISQFKVIFKSDNGEREFPFWNNINGPIADAIWHCGQVVLLRRSSGNPINSKVSVFSGKLRQ